MTTLKDLSKGLGNPFKSAEKGTSYSLTQSLNQGTYTFALSEEIDVAQVGLWLGDEYIGFFCDGNITFHLANDINSNDLIIKSLSEGGEVKRVKLEKGAIANKWTPAHEDLPKTDKIRFFKYVKIISKPHEIDDSMLIKKQTIHLDDPSQNTIEVGVEVSSFTDKQLEANNTIKKINADYVTNEKMTNVITPITVQVSEIIQEANRIELSVSELRTDLENEIERVETETNGRIDITNTAITTEVSERKTADGEILDETRGAITVLSDEIDLKVDKNGIISAINVSPELIKILSKNIALEGYTSINDHFKVLTNGDVQMVNADVSGKITATTGEIGNFSLNDGVLEYTTDVYNRDYTYSDMVVMIQIVTNQLTPNAYQNFAYDIDNNGIIDVVDMAMLQAHLRGDYQIEKSIKSRVRLGTADGRVETTVMYGTNFDNEGPSFVMQGERLSGTLVDTDALSIGNNPVADFPIEQGDNYTKWNSGKLEQWGRSVVNSGIKTPTGALFHSPDINIEFTTPFVGIAPHVTASFLREDRSGFVTFRYITNTNMTVRTIMSTTFDSGFDYYINWHAVGRWK